MRADARRSHAKLVEAATAAFAERGAEAPLEDIARRAGVGIGTLYRHFPTRLDLQAAVYLSQVNAVCEKADDLIISAPPEQALAGWLHALAGYMVTKRGLSRALIGALGKDSELISGCWVAMHDAADRLLTHAQQAGVLRTDISADDVLRLLHGIVVTTEQAPEQTDRLLSLMLDGLRPQRSLQTRRPVLVRRAEHHRGARGDAGRAADPLQQLLQRRGGRDAHLEDVVLLPRHAVAGLDRGEVAQPFRHVIGRGRVEWLDRHERRQR